MFSKHVTKDISAYCQGELSSEASKQFAEHIISCVKCRTEFEEIKFGIKLAEQLPQLSAPDSLWHEVESLLGKETLPVSVVSWRKRVAIAAAVLVVFSIGIVWVVYNSRRSSAKAWQVTRLEGAPTIGAEKISSRGSLAIGQWLETDGSSRAQIAVGSIGNVEIDENTRVRLIETRPTEHRLELARGKMSARIWAPPRLFFVDTPSAVAADLGCAYTLEVDDRGAGRLSVTSGWVALQTKERETIVPAGASCETELGKGPGTPYFDDSTPEFKNALREFDREPGKRTEALASILSQSRMQDTLTLYHLLPRLNEEDRTRVYEKMAGLAPPPNGVTCDGVVKLDQKMLAQWRDSLETMWGPGGKGVPKNAAEWKKSFKSWKDVKSKEAVK
jgi:hypothetical protein